MKGGRISALLLASAMLFTVAGCGDDGGEYEGVGRLVAERNRARLAHGVSKKQSPGAERSSSSGSMGVQSSREVLLEEAVNIVGASSGKILAKGIAYVDENGKIITIRIRK